MASFVTTIFSAFILTLSFNIAWAKWGPYPESEPEHHGHYEEYEKPSPGYSPIPNGVHPTTRTTFSPPTRTTTIPPVSWTPTFTTGSRSTTRPTGAPPTTTRPTWETQTTTRPTWGPSTTNRPTWGPPTTTRPTTDDSRPGGVTLRPKPYPDHNSLPEPEHPPHYEQEEIDEKPIFTKTCEMTCRTTTKMSPREWKAESFWTVINSGYTCRMQELGKMMLDSDKYCDLYINSIDPATNKTRYYCTHASVLSMASERLRQEVADAIDRHVRDVNRDRDQLPSYDWPSLPPQVIKSVVEYIYTNRMTGFGEQHNIIGLYVGAFFADLWELMYMIEDYLYETFDVVEQLNQFATYFRWAHITNNAELKENLMRIGSIILKMDQDQFEEFIDDICASSDYNRIK